MEKIFYAAWKAGRIEFDAIPEKYQDAVKTLEEQEYLSGLGKA